MLKEAIVPRDLCANITLVYNTKSFLMSSHNSLKKFGALSWLLGCSSLVLA